MARTAKMSSKFSSGMGRRSRTAKTGRTTSGMDRRVPSEDDFPSKFPAAWAAKFPSKFPSGVDRETENPAASTADKAASYATPRYSRAR